MTSNEQKRTERLAYVGALAGAMVHEIRNPLSTINMNLQMLDEAWADLEGEKGRWARRRLEILQNEAKRLDDILKNFQKIAKGEDLSLEDHDLNAIVEETLDFFLPDARAKNIVIRRGLSPDLPKVRVDAGLVKQALINMLKNSREAMPDGGEIIVRTSAAGEGVQLDIADTGAGIPEEKRARIFDPYFSTKKTGSGLGLATTKRIIEDFGGTICCQSEADKGTNFTIRIPASGKV